MDEHKRKHLDFIQLTITRMAANSFLLKGWSVTLIAALFALSAKDEAVDFAFIALFPAVMFWGLDGFFLRQERLFRELYDKVRVKDGETIDFSMSTSSFERVVPPWFQVAFSRTLFAFHGSIFATVILVIVIAIARAQGNLCPLP